MLRSLAASDGAKKNLISSSSLSRLQPPPSSPVTSKLTSSTPPDELPAKSHLRLTLLASAHPRRLASCAAPPNRCPSLASARSGFCCHYWLSHCLHHLCWLRIRILSIETRILLLPLFSVPRVGSDVLFPVHRRRSVGIILGNFISFAFDFNHKFVFLLLLLLLRWFLSKFKSIVVL